MDKSAFSSGFGPVSYAPRRPVAADRREAEAVLTQIPGVQGVGEGSDSAGDPTWLAYVDDQAAAALLPTRVGRRSVTPMMSGRIGILPAGARRAEP